MFLSRRNKSDLFQHLTKSLSAAETENHRLMTQLTETQAALDYYVAAVAELTKGDAV